MPQSLTSLLSTNSNIGTAASISSIANPKGSSPLDGTLIPPLIQAVGEFWEQSVTSELKGQLIWFAISILLILGIYCLCLIVSRYLELNKPRHFLKVTFTSKTSSKLDFASQFLTLLSRLHTLAKSSVITFEIHKSNKQGGNFAGFIFTSTDLAVLEVIQQDLMKNDGVSAQLVNRYQDLIVEPLTAQFRAFEDRLDVRPYQLQLIGSSEFGNFRLDQNQLIKNLVDSLQTLEEAQYGSVVITFRPVSKEHIIKSRIAALNHRSTKDADKYGVNQNMLAEVKELQLKNQYPMFQVRIVVLGNSRQVVNNLASSFNLLCLDNRLNQRLANFNLKSLRFLPRENLFKFFNRPAFGSLLNTRELSSLVQIASFGDGGELKNKENLERSMEIASDGVATSGKVTKEAVSSSLPKFIAIKDNINQKTKSKAGKENRKLSKF